MLFTGCMIWHGVLCWQCHGTGPTLKRHNPHQASVSENCLSLLADPGGRSELQLTYLQLKLTHDLEKSPKL